ncbi:putative T7SS-secreted protein [Nocardia sp. alder85J]|uniref:putative T7SS-secreted protein n=1 Tax=Nocardia sp. alder85J TaxID=2862949 RepID=UPI001CD7602D|nr:hypothetical protein [Nocardia sp. alder85J]MCX4092710.1 hypothetical protein [Nocardia sp. alder85J]
MGLFDSIGAAIDKANDTITRVEGKAEGATYDAAASAARAFGANGVAAQLQHAAEQVVDASGGTVTERELGETDDPTELIHGDPAAIAHVHDLLQQLGDSLEKTGDALRKIDVSDWIGAAAQSFHTEFEKQPKLWWTGADALHKAAGILDTWYHGITAAQGRAADAITKWKQAAAEELSKKTAWNALSAEQRKSTPLADTWTAMRNDAREILRGARADRDSAAATAAAGLRAATATAPDTPPLSQRLLDDFNDANTAVNDAAAHFTKGLTTSFAEIAQFTRQLDPYDTYNLTHPAQYLQNTADLATGLVTAAADPGATVDAFLKDTRKNPSEFLGSLTGNTLMTIGTGGAGAAKPALTAMKDATEASDATRAARAAEDAADHPLPPAAPEPPKPGLPGDHAPAPKPEPLGPHTPDVPAVPPQSATPDTRPAPSQPAAQVTDALAPAQPTAHVPDPPPASDQPTAHVADAPTTPAQPATHITEPPSAPAQPAAGISDAPTATAQSTTHISDVPTSPAQPAAHISDSPSAPAQPATRISDAPTASAPPTAHISDASTTPAPAARVYDAPTTSPQPAGHVSDAPTTPAQPAARAYEAPTTPAQPGGQPSGIETVQPRTASPYDGSPATVGTGGTQPYAAGPNPVAAHGPTPDPAVPRPADPVVPNPDTGTPGHGSGRPTASAQPAPVRQAREVTPRTDDPWRRNSSSGASRSPHPDSTVPEAGRSERIRPEQVSPTGRNPGWWNRQGSPHRVEPADPYRPVESTPRPGEHPPPPAESIARPSESTTHRVSDRSATQSPDHNTRPAEPYRPDRAPDPRAEYRPPADRTDAPPQDHAGRPEEPHRRVDGSPATSSAHAPAWDRPSDHPATRPGAEHAPLDTPGTGAKPEPPMRRAEWDRAPDPRDLVDARPDHPAIEHPGGEHPEPGGEPPNRPTEPKPSLGDLFPPDNVRVDEARLLPQLQRAIDGEYAGVRVHVYEVNGHSQALHIRLKMYDTDGVQVGKASRSFSYMEGRLTVEHTSFSLAKHMQGQGCATAWNKAMFQWYKDSGVDTVTLKANIDVGSYAWARQGFEFLYEDQAVQYIRPRLREEITTERGNLSQLMRESKSLPAGPEKSALNKGIEDLTKVITKSEALLKNFQVGSPRFPTAKEISELGRPNGFSSEQLRELTWLGKRVLMRPGGEVHWHGVKKFDVE